MTEINNWHPYPRYGVASAMHVMQRNKLNLNEKEEVEELLFRAMEEGLEKFMIFPLEQSDGREMQINYGYLEGKKVAPGKKSGQISGNGFYTAGHIVTANNSAGIVKEVKAFQQLIQSGKFDFDKPYELKRSFAPLVAKRNKGKLSMSNPRVGSLIAAFTAIATLTSYKPATYTQFKAGDRDAVNIGLIPDIPFYDDATQSYPLLEFIRLFDEVSSSRDNENRMLGRYEKKYVRPKIFQGNYPEAPRNSSLGAISILVAIGEWVKEGREMAQYSRGESAEIVLRSLANRPIYLVSNAGTRQETFDNHLVGITLDGTLKKIVSAIYRTRLVGDEQKEKGESNKMKNFRMMADRFLRLFTEASFKDFLAFRATYPHDLKQLFNTYFMKPEMKLTPELVTSARVYGESLNYAAFFAAAREKEDDNRKGRQGLTKEEYKDKVLSEFESTILSADTGIALLSQLSTRAGRITKREIKHEAIPFMEAVALGSDSGGIGLDTAKQLITAFMRVSTYEKSKSGKSINEGSSLYIKDDSLDEDRPNV